MCNRPPSFLFLLSFALSLFTFALVIDAGAQTALTGPEKLQMHRELSSGQFMPNEWNNEKTTPGKRFSGSGFFTTQVNVNSSGDNIVGDAANEPSIGINPLNPSNIVIGWRQFATINNSFRQAGVAYSHDGGDSWTFPGPIDPQTFRSDPVIKTDSAGIFYYNSLTSNSGVYTCRVFRSSDGGVTWDDGVEARGGDKQWMTIDRSGGVGKGNIYSSWTSYYSSCEPGQFTRSTDGGNSYENCRMVDGNPYWGTMTVGNNGELFIAGAGSGDGIQVVQSANAQIPGSSINWDFTSQVWMDGYVASGPTVNPVGLLGQAYIDVDRSNGPGRGNVYVLASMVRISNGDPGDVMFSKSTDGGYTWSPPLRLNNDPTIFHHQWLATMSVAPNGRIDVVWLDTRNDPNVNLLSSLYYCYSADQGQTWSINKQLSQMFDPQVGYPQQSKMGDYFDMYSDDAGAHLAWANTLNGEQDVYYTHIIPSITGTEEPATATERPVLEFMPNPVKEKCMIKYTVPRAGHVVVELWDLRGVRVAKLIDEERRQGMYTHDFDASNLPAGYYTGKLTVGGVSAFAGMVRVR